MFSVDIGAQCHYKLYMYDSYGDGWNGAYLEVTMNGTFVGNYECQGSFTLDSVYSTSGSTMDFIFHSGSWDSEITFTIVDPLNDTLYSGVAPSNLDNLLHTSTSTCAPPSGNCNGVSSVTLTNITTNSADISWSPGANDSLWNVEFGVSGFAIGSGTQITNLQNTLVSLNTLQSSSSYDVYVQSVCDSGYISSWNGPHSFTTAFTTGTCGAFTIELYDSWGDGWNGGYLEVLVNGNFVQALTIQQGAGPDQFFISVDSSDVIDLLYTPGGWPEENSYIVYDHLNALVTTQMGNGTSGPPNTIGLTACPLCFPPGNLSATNISATGALLGWNSSSGILGGSWNVEWGTSGFVMGSGTTILNVTTSSYLLTGIPSFTSYDFYVQEDCGQSGFSNWAGPYTFSTPPEPGTCGMYSVALYDSYGDGWNGGFLDVNVNNNIILTATLLNGSGPEYFDFPVDSGDIVNLVYTSGDWSNENSYDLFDENNNIIASQSGSQTSTGPSGPLSTFGLFACNDLISQGNCGLLRVELFDDYCDGWTIYGASMDLIIDGLAVQTISLPSGCGPETFLFPVDSGAIVDLVYSTTFQNEHSYKVYDQFGALIHEKTSAANNGNGPESTYGIELCDSPQILYAENADVFIYPNPASSKIYIQSNIIFTKVEVTNLIGQTIISEESQSFTEIDVSILPKGNYLLNLYNKEMMRNSKITIMR